MEILEAVYRPPTPEPVPEARESPVWDAEEDEQPPAEPLAPITPARARPKMVSPTKGQPSLFEHFVLGSSTARASAGPSMPAQTPKPAVPAPAPQIASEGAHRLPS